ncbi:MAG: hypothetical protein JSS49_11280 [Planctomycetes bacterium]|nr:hypothetical protein [Planctomycetota bacterium]
MPGLKIAGQTRVLWMVTLLTGLVTTVTSGIEALAAEPVPKPAHSLAYVPRDTKLIASVRISALKASPGLSSLQEFLAKDQTFEQQTGVSLDRVEQIVLVGLTDEEGSTIAVIHTMDSDDATLMVKTLQPDPEEQTFGGQTYVRRKAETGKPVCVFADGKIVVAAQEEKHLRRLIIAGAEGATWSKWASLWRSTADADAIALVNIQKLRSSAAIEGPFNLVGLFVGIPTQLAPLVELSTVLVTVEATDRIHARIQLAGDETVDLKKILTGAKAFVDFSQALLSSIRNDASSDGGQHAELTLELCDRIDGLLDAVTVRLNEGAVVEATVAIPEDEFAQLFKLGRKLAVTP